MATEEPSRYTLEDRTRTFAQRVRKFVAQSKKRFENVEDFKQLLRSSGSVGANYREANDSLGKNDFLFRIKIARKEAKESKYWLECLLLSSANEEIERESLKKESYELERIFGAILRNAQSNL